MKWAAAVLCLLGISAAICAAFLVSTLRASTVIQPVVGPTTNEVQPMVQVLYATKGMSAMTVVDAKAVIIREVPKNQVPKDYIDRPVDVVGKIISIPVVEGQAFTTACFAEKATARQVADAIPFGKRAVGISVTDYAGLEGMLFPGSSVDVMVAFKPQEGQWDQAVTATLLENIQVLGIEQQTVISPDKAFSDTSSYGRGNSRRVTLLVDTEQAKRLQLAMGYGTLSLALRNPLDATKTNKSSMSVKKLLGDLAPLQLFNAQAAMERMANKAAADAKAEAAKPVVVAGAPTTKPAPEPPKWDIMVIRGGVVSETKSFPVPKPQLDLPLEAVNASR